MIQNTHWKQLARNWASILFGNALYSLAVAFSSSLRASSPAVPPASRWPSGG